MVLEIPQPTVQGKNLASSTESIWTWPLVAVACAWVVVLVLFRDTAVGMVAIWYRSETFNHCFVVLPISAWLVWRQRQGLAHIRPRPSPWILPGIVVFAAAWLLGDMVAVNSVTQFSLVAMLVLTVPLILGVHVALAMLFPLVFLFFSVPFGEFLMPQLMELTADFTVAALRFSGIPVLREGLQFVIPSGNWSVVEACSGVRYLIASLTVGTLFAYLNYQSLWRRLLFVLVALLVPIVANWLRAYMIVMLGHFSGNTLAVGVDHLIYGWVFFGVVILLMFIVGARWSEPERAFVAGAGQGQAGLAATSRRGVVLATLFAFVIVVAAPQAVQWALEHREMAGSPTLTAPPALAGQWQRDTVDHLEYEPSFRNPSVEINQVYRSDRGVVGLYIGYYRNQDYGRKLVSSDNVLVASNNGVWARVRRGTREVPLETVSQRVRFVELRRLGGVVAGESDRLVAWQVYWIDGALVENDYLAKLQGAWMRLMGRGDESAAIVVYARQSATTDASPLLSAFLVENHERIDAMLRQVRNSH